MKKVNTVRIHVVTTGLAGILVSSMILGLSGCATQQTTKYPSQQTKTQPAEPAPDTRDENTIRASAKHYANGQPIPGVGTAMGDVYILPDGGCFGGEGKSGIRWSNGAQAWFGDTISAQSPMRLVQPGSPATQ